MIIALTGYTGCGKSYIAARLYDHATAAGYTAMILDADAMARKLRDESPEVKLKIKALLGHDVYDQNDVSIPEKISARVFGLENKKIHRQYAQIFLDVIPAMVRQRALTKTEDLLILDFFFLFEYLNDCLDIIDKIVLITCSEQTQLERLTTAPRSMQIKNAVLRIQNQRRIAPLDQLILKVDLIIENDTTQLDETKLLLLLDDLKRGDWFG